MASKTDLRRRIVVCVDGTWFDEDGREGRHSYTVQEKLTRPELTVFLKGRGRGNNSNVFRLWASVKQGRVTDENGNEFEQVYII